jgi:hypothetical protein
MAELIPFRLAILRRLTTLLAAIAPADGYTFSLGAAEDAPEGRVFRGRAAYGENDPLPMVSMIEDPRNLEQDMAPGRSPSSQGDWNLLIQGFLEDEVLHPTDPAYFLLADVKRALVRARAQKRNILGFGGKSPCIADIRLGAGVVRPPDEISAKTYFWLPVTLELVEDHENVLIST